MKRDADAAGLHLEPLTGRPALLRFAEGGRPLFGEVDPTDPRVCAERCLLQSFEESKWRRDGGGGDDNEVFGAEERGRVLRELQQKALDELRGTEQVTELLQRTFPGESGERTQFLRLHKAIQDAKENGELVALAEAGAEAMTGWPAVLRDAGQVVAASRRHADFEGVLRDLKGAWPIWHSGGGHYIVEVWSDRPGQNDIATADAAARPAATAAPSTKQPRALDDPGGDAQKYFAVLSKDGQLGVRVNFPLEFGRLVKWRHRLSVEVSLLDAIGGDGHDACLHPSRSSHGGAVSTAVPPVFSESRGRAIHAALCEAREAIVDLCAFRRFCSGIGKSSRPAHWHVLRSSSAEVLFAVPVHSTLGEQLVGVSFRYGGGTNARDSDPGEDDAGLWRPFGELVRLKLRELYIECLEGSDGIGASGREGQSHDDLLARLAHWLGPRLEAAVRCSGTKSATRLAPE